MREIEWVTNLPGHRRMVDVLKEALARTQRVDIAVSYVRCTGVALLYDQLKAFSRRGGVARVLSTTSMHITQPDAIRALNALPGIECRVHASNLMQSGAVSEGFHAKIYLFELGAGDALCAVGSSNLSSGGLITNIESNVVGDSDAHIEQARALFHTLWNHPDVFALDEMLSSYTQAYLEAFARTTSPTDAGLGVGASAQDVPLPNAAQIKALEALARLRDLGESKAVVIAATGVGKTFLGAFDALACNASRVLFVSHRLEHLHQARGTFERVFGGRRTQGMLHGGLKERDCDHVFATIQSAMSAQHGVLDMSFDYVIIDEFHHADAPSYRKFIAQLDAAFLLGLTATPERADGRDVLELCDYNVAYEVRLVEAIERGWLIPFHYYGIADETVDYDAIPWRNRGFDPNALEHALMLDARAEHVLEHALARGYDGASRVTVGFCAGVRHADYMARMFNTLLERRGLDSAAVSLTGSSTLGERVEIYARLQSSDDPLQWLFVADLLNEGVDLPALNSLLFLRPTQSTTVFLQQLGRGLRRHESCEVLTVLDFVGHHNHAWSALEALHDAGASVGPSTLSALGITPPRHCEIILDDLTQEVIAQIKARTTSWVQVCDDIYLSLREEMGRPPMPIDLWGRTDAPEYPKRWRGAGRFWMHMRKKHEDASAWERSLSQAHSTATFLSSLEADWQQQRVHAYALLWGLIQDGCSPEQGYDAFFERFPRWCPEYKPLADTSAWKTLSKKLDPTHLCEPSGLSPLVLDGFPDMETCRAHVMGRLMFWLQRDYMMRHAGVLRTPADLVRHRRYSRQDIMNHFGRRYDPTRHNKGVIEFKGAHFNDHIVLICKIDTSNAREDYQYKNAFLNPSTMTWQSQNSQVRAKGSGARLVNHASLGVTLHMFVQARKGETPLYCGEVHVREASGDKPINVTFELEHALPPMVYEALGEA